MAKRPEADIAALITRLCGDSSARLVADGAGGNYRVEPHAPGGAMPIAQATLSSLCARGLLFEAEPGSLRRRPSRAPG